MAGCVSKFGIPDLGIGVGFRVPHYRQVVEEHPAFDWFEALSENHMVEGGGPRLFLDRLCGLYPVVPHGVSMSLGGVEDPSHTRELKKLVDRIDPPWFSDHLCWSGTRQKRLHDLVPVPYTEPQLEKMIERIRKVQDQFGRLFAVENVSAYLCYRDSVIAEWDFLAELAEKADCGLLLDVNNIFVSSVNLGFDPVRFLEAIPKERVVQIHLAGHSVYEEGYRLDTHDHPVCEEVWTLYREAIRRLGPVSTLIEWDGNIPTLERLRQEAELARYHRDLALSERAA